MPSESNTIDDFGKSITNDFNITVANLVVNEDALVKGDLTVLGDLTFDNLNINNLNVDNATITNLTLENPLPTSSGGTGLATIGTAGQVLTVNSGGTALIYAAPSLTNPSIITGTGFTGNPTLSLGLEADTGSLGRGFIRTGVAAVNGLFLGTASATVLRLWSNFATDSNAEIINTNANFTYNSTSSSGVFQVLSGGGGISFTNSGIGTISMATAAGNLSMSAGAGTISLTTGVGATSITTGAGPISLTTGAGNISLTTAAAGIISLTVSTAGAINIGTALGAVNLYGSLLTLAAPAIYIGTALIPSVLVFACGDVTGVTGFWNITTLAFQLNAVSISLNSTLTIALNNNTTIGGFLSASGNVLANSGNLFSTTALNPSVTVYKSSVDHYGMDLGYSATTGRFRTRIFAPVGNDIALSTHTASPTSQSNFTDKLIINSTTGVISLNGQTSVTGTLETINGNIITNQNIVGGVEIINNGNLALTVASPGNILIRGGSGSIITLPNATTLLVGYVYTINNNTSFPTIVNRFTSGTVGTVPALNAATVICTGTSSANGDWDINITGPTTATDWANPGQIGSAVPNTGVFTTLTASFGNIFTNQNIINGVIILNTGNVIPLSASSPGTILVRGGTGSIIILPDATTLIIGFTYTITNSTNSSVFIKNYFSQDVIGTIPALSAAAVTCLDADFLNGFWDIHITGPSTIVNWGTPGQIGSTVPNTGAFTILSASVMNTSGNVLANSGNLFSTTALNPSVTVYKSSTDHYGMDLGYNATTSRFRTRIFAPVGQDIALSTHTASPTSQSNFIDKLIVNSTTGVISINGTTNVTDGNIFTNQNIIGGVEIINSGNLSLSAASPGYILIKGGSGSTITLPNATTLIVGYIYTINNNTSFPTIVNRFTSGTVGTVPALNAATVICTGTSSENGDWDIHITGPTTATDWANPGAIGSGTANTGAFTSLTANANFNSEQLSLNPGLTVYSNQGYIYGMDLGYNVSTSRYRTRIFCPNAGTADISLSTYTYNPLLPITQTRFTDRLIVRGDTGNIELLSNTSLTGTFSSTGNVLVNSSNLTNTVSFNPAVTVFSDTLNAYGMDLGYNDSVSRYRTRIFCPALSVADIALSTRAQNGTDQSAFTDRLVVRGATGEIEMLSKTTFTALLSGSFTDSPFTFINTATMPLFTSAVLAPNVASGNVVFSAVGKSLTPGNCLFLGYNYTPIPTAVWSMYNSNTSITQIFDGNINIVAPVTTTSGTVTIGGYLRVSGDVPIISAGSGVCMGLQADGFAVLTLNGTGTNGGYIEFSQDGTDFHTRIMGLVTKQMEYTATTHIFQSFISDVYSPLFKINGGISSNIELLTNSTVSGYLRVFGNVPTSSAGSGVCMGLQNDGYAAITLNGTGAQAGYIDFSQNGTDFYCRIMGKPSKELEFSADTYTFLNTAQDTSFLLLNNIFTANIRGTAGILGNCFLNSANISNQNNLNPALTVYNNEGYKYGIDLGYNLTSLRYRTRIFCPNTGAGDISLATANLNPTLQSDFTDRLIVRGDTGNVEITSNTTISANLTVTTGNIIGNQNIVENITVLNNGNLALNVNSPGVVLIRGGSGSTITLPNANTLIPGFSYIINNNSNHNAIVNQFESGSVGTVIPGNSAHIICYNTNSLNGQWDIHISGTAQTVDWANPGTIGSATPNTGAFTTLTATSFIKANSNNSIQQINLNPAITVFSDASNSYGMDLGYDASVSRYRTRIFCPAVAVADIALSTRAENATTQANFADRLVIRGDTGNIEMLSQTTVSGYLRVNGNVPIISAGSGVCMGLQNDGYAAITLNGTGANVGYIDFSQNGTDYLTRIISFPSKEMNYWADKHVFANTDNNITFMRLNDTYTANIRGSCGMINSCFVNTNHAASTTALNPSVTVYDNGGYRYGMDLGYNSTTARFRTRIFCPNVGSGDIALATTILNSALQSDFTDRLIVRGDTGNVEINTLTNTETIIGTDVGTIESKTKVIGSFQVNRASFDTVNEFKVNAVNCGVAVTSSRFVPIDQVYNGTGDFYALRAYSGWLANSLSKADLEFGRNSDNYQSARIRFTNRAPNTGSRAEVFSLGYTGFPFLACDQFNSAYFYDGFNNEQAKIIGNVGRTGLVFGGDGVVTARSIQTTDINRLRCVGNAAGSFPNGYFIEFMNESNTGVGSISFNGANTVYNSSSDYRLKTNIEPLSDPLAKILQLNPKSYTMIESQINSYGFIAHEVAEIIPELVMGEKDAIDEEGQPRYQQIDYSRFTPYTVGAIKDLYSLIETLQSQVQTLQSQVSLLNQ